MKISCDILKKIGPFGEIKVEESKELESKDIQKIQTIIFYNNLHTINEIRGIRTSILP